MWSWPQLPSATGAPASASISQLGVFPRYVMLHLEDTPLKAPVAAYELLTSAAGDLSLFLESFLYFSVILIFDKPHFSSFSLHI